MSSNNNTKHNLQPKLRFPEFKSDKAWAIISLKNMSVPVTDPVGEKTLMPVSISAGIGFVPQSEKFGRDISGNQYSLYTHIKRGDFVFNKGNSLKFPQGCVYQLKDWDEVAAPNVFISFKLKSGFSPQFYAYCFEKNLHGLQLRKSITSGARSNGLLNISKKIFFDIDLPFPHIDEQQKIANCLSSLDVLIAAQAQKVEALKAHKKGLMQELFPAEGETLPKLRFPEFRDVGGWEEKPLWKICDVLQGYGFPEVLQGGCSGKYPFCKVSDISKAVADKGGDLDMAANYIGDDELLKLRAKLIPIGATVFAKIGEALRLNRRALVKKECLIDNNAIGLKAIRGIAEDYFVYLLSQKIDLNEHCGGAVPSVNKSTLQEIMVTVPNNPKEQKRIADCLSSLDTLITAQSQKLETLRQHKKGLMQQLFPSPEDVEA